MTVLAAFISNTLFNFVIGLLLARFLGPDDYGRFALAVAVAVGVQTVAFDWARVAAARFYSERVSVEQPRLRATIDATLACLVAGLGCIALVILLSGVNLELSRGLAALAVVTAAVNGVFDYQTALIRARFQDRLYARLIIGKNLLSMVLTVGGAFWLGSAAVALSGVCLSMGGALLGLGRALFDGRPLRRMADPKLAGTLLRYALPVVAANLLYQTIPFVDRFAIARLHGFAQSGQFSLAYDIGVRIVAAVGSALDVLLFQIAVRADEAHGVDHAKSQIGANIGIVFAILAPVCVGCWLVLPSFEAIVVPPEFRGPFAHYLRLLLPGLFCYGMIFFAIQPLFQIGKRTAPLIGVAVAASLANGVFLLVLPATADAAHFAIAQGLSLGLGFALLTVLALQEAPVWPRGRDLCSAAAATIAMAAVVSRLDGMTPGVGALAAAIALGVVTYGAIAWATDLCHIRSIVTALRHSKRHA